MKQFKIIENALPAAVHPAGKKVAAESLPGFTKIWKPRRFVGSLRFAVQGILYFFRTERNAKIQSVAAILIIIAGFLFHLSIAEWLWIIACIAAVFSLEMVNTALEEICNLVTTDYHARIKIIKDVAAGAVAVSVAMSVAIAFLIFLPKIMALL